MKSALPSLLRPLALFVALALGFALPAEAAEATKCLDGKVSVQVPAGLEQQGNSADACRFGRFSSADYAVFNYVINRQANEAASAQAIVTAKIAAIQGDAANKGVTVLSQGAHSANPLTDYIAVVKYHRDVKVGHDVRTYYYKVIYYGFGGASGGTHYYASTSVQNENGAQIDALFASEQNKFYAFINSIRMVLVIKNIKLNRKAVEVAPVQPK